MSAPIVELWSDVECAGGIRQHVIPYVLNGSRMPLPIDRRGMLTMVSSRLTKDGTVVPWFADAVIKKSVIRVEQPKHGLITEWRLFGLTDGFAGERALIQTVCEPLVHILKDVGPMRSLTTGGGSYYRLGSGEAGYSISQFCSGFILPFLAALPTPITWIAAGTIALAHPYKVALDRWTPLQLAVGLEERSGLEFDFRRNGSTNYLLDWVTAIGGSEPEVLVAVGRNAISYSRARTGQGYATVMQVSGAVPEGGLERATSGLAVWRVSAVSTDDVTLEDPAGGAGPVKFTNQYASPSKNYLLANNGNLRRIESTTTGQVLSLIAGGGADFAVGNLVEIRKDSDGSLLEEAIDPDSTIRIVASVIDEDQRGERNYQTNPFPSSASSWGSPGRVNATVSGSGTITIKEVVPNNHAFSANAVLVIGSSAAANPGNYGVGFRITGAATAVAGVVTFSVSPNISATINAPVWIYDRATLPSGWVDPNNATSKAAIWQRRPTNLTDLVGLANGVYSTTTHLFSIDGLTPSNQDIHPGDVLLHVSTGNRYPIMLPATVSGGAATIAPGAGQFGVPTGIADNDSIQIIRPAFDQAVPNTEALVVFARAQNAGDSGSMAGIFDLPGITIKRLPDRPKLHARLGVTLRGFGGIGMVNQLEHGFLQLWDDDADLLLAEAPLMDADGFKEGLAQDVRAIVDIGYTMTVDRAFRLKLVAPGRMTPGTLLGNTLLPCVMYHWAGLIIGSDDPNTPPIRGGHGTRLRQLENVYLALTRQSQAEWQVTSHEIEHLLDATPPEPKIVRGGSVRFVDERIGIDQTFRNLSPDYSLTDESDTVFTLQTKVKRDFDLIERRISQERHARQAKDIQIIQRSVSVPETLVAGESERSVSVEANLPAIKDRVEAAQTSLGAAVTPIGPSQQNWIPGYTGLGSAAKTNNNFPSVLRANWVPFLVTEHVGIMEVSIETGGFTGAPTSPTAKILFATMDADRLLPEEVIWASEAFALSALTVHTVTNINFHPGKGIWYLVGVLVDGAFADASNFVTIRRWDDPTDSDKRFPVPSAGGDYGQSAAIATQSEITYDDLTETGPVPWAGSVIGYVGEATCFWFKTS